MTLSEMKDNQKVEALATKKLNEQIREVTEKLRKDMRKTEGAVTDVQTACESKLSKEEGQQIWVNF